MTPADIAKARFWDRAARRYAARQITNMDAYERTLERSRAWLKPDDRVLEIGCGTGTTALRLAPHAGHITGSDISQEMIAIAEEKRVAEGTGNVAFIGAPSSDARLEGSAFDAVLAFNVLHLLDELPMALNRVRSLLKPGGLMISKTPCLADMTVALRLLIPAMRLVGQAPPVNFLSKAALPRAVEEAGFRIEESGLHAAKGNSLFIVARKR